MARPDTSRTIRKGAPAVWLVVLGLLGSAAGQTAAVTIEGTTVGSLFLRTNPGAAFLGDATQNLGPGTYTVSISPAGPSYGSFTVASDLSVSATGSLTATQSGPESAVIGFDLGALASVTVQGGSVGSLFLHLAPGSTGFLGSRTFALPPGSYPLQISRSSLTYGTVTVAADLSLSVDGSLTATATGALTSDVDFDLTALAGVTVAADPLAPLFLVLQPGSTGFFGDRTFYLPDGSFSLGVSQTANIYGSFTVSGGVVASADGALQPGADGLTIGVDPCLTERVVVRPEPGEILSIDGSTAIAGEKLLFLAAGNYTVRFTNPTLSAGFSVGPAGLSDAALPAAGPTRLRLELVACDAAVRVLGTQVGSLFLRLQPSGGVFLGDRTFALEPGVYDLQVGLQGASYGSITVGNDLSVQVSGGLTAASTGPVSADVGFDATALAAVQILGGAVPGLFLQLEPAASTGFLGDRSFLLPPGSFGVHLSQAGAAYGELTVANDLQVSASGRLTAVQTSSTSADVGFDASQLAAVEVLGSRVGPLFLQLPSSTGFLADRGFLLPPGSYPVRLSASATSYGSFEVAADLSLLADGALLAAGGSGQIDFDLGALAEVTLQGSSAGPMVLRMLPGTGGFSGDQTFALPTGNYLVSLLSGQSYGSFSVGADLSVAVTGSLSVVPGAGAEQLVAVDPCAANQVTATPAPGEVVTVGSSQPLSVASQLVLPSGSYQVQFAQPPLTSSVAVGPSGLSATTLPSAEDARLSLALGFCPSNLPPSADAGADQLGVPAGSGCVADVTLDGSGSDDPDADPLSYTWTGSFGSVSGVQPVVSLGLGSHTVQLVVSDGQETDQDDVVIEVVDASAPQLSGVPAPLVVECEDGSGADVSLVPPTAYDACDGAVPVASNAPERFPPGMTVVTFSASDAAGNVATATTTVTVVDTTPPSLEVVCATPHTLWPANHKLVDVTVRLRATDLCTPSQALALEVWLSSDEPDDVQGGGDGKTTGDTDGFDGFAAPLAVGTSFVFDPTSGEWAASFALRAERQGGGDGRIYSLVGEVSDQDGNGSPLCVEVFVPHSQGAAHPCNDHQCDLHECTEACPDH